MEMRLMPNHPILSTNELQALPLPTTSSSEFTGTSKEMPAILSPEMKLIHELRRELVLITNRVAELEQTLVAGQTPQQAQQATYVPPAVEVNGLTSRSEKFGIKPPLVKRIRNFYT
jgi:hypothetical protein